MRRSRGRAFVRRFAAGLAGTAVMTVGAVGPAWAAPVDDLLVPSAIQLGDAAPGTSVAVPARLHYSGDEPSDGITFVFGGYRAGVELREYGDCTYYHAEYDLLPTEFSGAVCHLTGTLQPDTDYEIVAPDGAPIRLDVASDAQGPWRQTGLFEVNPRDHESWTQTRLRVDAQDGLLTATKGTGAPLRLVAKGAGTAGPDWRPNQTTFYLRTTANPYDFEALGATAAGEAGDTVPVTVGVRNHGPSTVAVGEHDARFRLRVTVPAGAKAVEVPRYCVPATTKWGWDTDVPTEGRPRYLCQFAALRADAKVTFPFKFEITEVVANATGPLELDLSDRPESNAANNTSKIIINPAAGAPDDDGTPGAGAPDDETAAGDGGGAGGGLPITGGNQITLILMAAALLTLGAGFLVVSRRRA